MDVGVDKPGQDDFSGHAVLHLAAVAAYAHDEPLRHGDIPLTDFVGKDIDIGGVFQHQIRLLPPGGHIHDPQLPVDLRGDFSSVALLVVIHRYTVLSSPMPRKSAAAGLLCYLSGYHIMHKK